MTDKNFIDWESHVFGYGYGTGEPPVITVLRQFFEVAQPAGEKPYNYGLLEQKMGAAATWLLINVLCHAGIIEYGSSPRYGWLTSRGQVLKNYLNEKTVDEACDILDITNEYVPCFPDLCQCGGDCDTNNPLWQGVVPQRVIVRAEGRLVYKRWNSTDVNHT